MSTTLNQIAASPVAVFATGSTSSMASAANALSAAQTPTDGSTYKSYPRGRFTFTGTFGAAPAANSAIRLYFVPSDGAGTPVYETDLGRSTTPVRMPAAVIALDTTNATQQRSSEIIDLPAAPFKVIAENNATGQTLAAGWGLTVVPATDQGV